MEKKFNLSYASCVDNRLKEAKFGPKNLWPLQNKLFYLRATNEYIHMNINRLVHSKLDLRYTNQG